MIKIEKLSKVQKIVLAVLCAVMALVIIFYIYKKDDNTNYSSYEDVYASNEEEYEEKNKGVIYVHVAGEVETPGVVELKEGERIVDAIEKAGGLTNEADIFDINLAYELKDGQKIYVPNEEEIEEIEGVDYVIEYITNESSGIYGDNSDSGNGKVNINTATQTELETLTGIGPSTALKIITYRNENGAFQSVEDIKNVSGIGESKYNSIKNDICVK